MKEGQGAEFIAGLLALQPDQASRNAVARYLWQYGGVTLYIPRGNVEAERRRQTARTQLTHGMVRPDVVTLLVLRYGCSKRTAQGDVSRAAQEIKYPLRDCG